MKRIFAIAVIVLSSLLAPHASAATPVEATLALPYDRVLPGVPFDLVITYTNTSGRPLTIGGALATLVVTFANGDTKVMHTPDVNDRWDVMPAMPLRLAPGQTAQQAVSWEYGSIPNWFRYDSFSGPGTYGIALELRIADDDENALGTVTTPAATLTRIEPAGIDAELWARMQQMSNGAWADNSFVAKKAGAELAGEILQLHPESGYYPYALALRALNRTDKNHIPALAEAAERFQSSPAYPYLLKAAADCARYEAWLAEEQRDVRTARKYFNSAQAQYRAALATRSVAIRASAENGMRDVAKGLERVEKKPAR